MREARRAFEAREESDMSLGSRGARDEEDARVGFEISKKKGRKKTQARRFTRTHSVW